MTAAGPGHVHRRGVLLASLAGSAALIGQPALAQAACGSFTRAAYDRYVALMNAQDTRFASYYSDDIQFEMGLRGKPAVLEFYRTQWLHVTETLAVDFFCSDARGAAAQVRSELRCIRDFDDSSIFGRALQAGEVQRVRGYVFYSLDDEGRIAEIKGPPPEVLQPWHLEAR